MPASFHDRMTLDQAVDELQGRIISYRAATGDTKAREAVLVAFFAVYFCLKFTRSPSWQQAGREVFDQLAQGVLEYLKEDFPSDLVNSRTIENRMHMYALAIEISSDNPTPANVAHGIGVSFALLHGKEHDRGIARVGADIFMKETDAMFEMFGKYDLVS